jgi:hypothetical protein
LTRSCSERFGLRAAQLVLKLKQTAGPGNLPVRFMHGSSRAGGSRGTAVLAMSTMPTAERVFVFRASLAQAVRRALPNYCTAYPLAVMQAVRAWP